jgi:hypothetical protein
LTLITSFHSLSLVSEIGFWYSIPALLIKKSIVPKASSIFVTKFLTDSALEMSHSMNKAFLPAA